MVIEQVKSTTIATVQKWLTLEEIIVRMNSRDEAEAFVIDAPELHLPDYPVHYLWSEMHKEIMEVKIAHVSIVN